MDKKTTKTVLDHLNRLLQLELEGVNRYLHHSFMVFGFSRAPIVSWLRAQSNEGLAHATILGEKIVALGGHPEVQVTCTWEPEQHSVKEMLEINLKAEQKALDAYHALLAVVPQTEVALEEMVRTFIATESTHVEELGKYLRAPE